MITEYPILDRLTGGFGKGALITLVGGSLVGRSIFALNIVRNQMDLEIAPITAFMTAEQSAEVAQQTLLKMVVDEGKVERIKAETVFVDIVKCCTDLDSLCQKIVLLVRVQKVEVVIIDSFHVSRAFRRRGIGRRLVETAADYARGRGASALYASCCSAEETIGFYKAMGFRLSEHPIPSCVEDEPFDIQMEYRL